MTCIRITSKYTNIGLDNRNLHILDYKGGDMRVVRASEKGLWVLNAWG